MSTTLAFAPWTRSGIGAAVSAQPGALRAQLPIDVQVGGTIDSAAAPSFEQMRSGVRVTLDAPPVSAPSILADWTHEQFVLTAQGLQSPASQPLFPTAADVALVGSFVAGGLS